MRTKNLIAHQKFLICFRERGAESYTGKAVRSLELLPPPLYTRFSEIPQACGDVQPHQTEGIS